MGEEQEKGEGSCAARRQEGTPQGGGRGQRPGRLRQRRVLPPGAAWALLNLEGEGGGGEGGLGGGGRGVLGSRPRPRRSPPQPPRSALLEVVVLDEGSRVFLGISTRFFMARDPRMPPSPVPVDRGVDWLRCCAFEQLNSISCVRMLAGRPP